eukprot:m.19312 g.19312  ORF g.19312 m.19312 type:complete len:201 (+) comp5917_c0_seq1:2544-3146(+)
MANDGADGGKQRHDALPRRVCEVCGDNQHLQQCTRCKQAFYCSRRCQVAAWFDHQPRCDAAAHNHQVVLSLKYNGKKYQVQLNNLESGERIRTCVAQELGVVASQLKLIHKGKVLAASELLEYADPCGGQGDDTASPNNNGKRKKTQSLIMAVGPPITPDPKSVRQAMNTLNISQQDAARAAAAAPLNLLSSLQLAEELD